MTKQKKWVLLGGLLFLWGLLLFTQFSDDSLQSGSLPSPVPARLQDTPLQSSSLAMADVLKPARQSVSFSNPRNIFAPLSFPKPAPPPPKPTPPPAVAQSPKRIQPKSPPPGPSPGELAAQQARQQLNKYRFLGYLKKGGESQAFLSNGKDIYIVRQGEIMEGRIQINKIDPTNIVLSTKVKETGVRIEATIPLTKDQKG